MTDFTFPEGVYPFAIDYYLQSHSGGSESPFSRQTKTYGLSAPRWVCTMRFRTAWDETSDQQAGSPVEEWMGEISAFIDKLEGRTHRALLWDTRREQDGSTLVNEAIDIDATQVTVSGGIPKIGGYIGGDGRPHRITSVTPAGGSTYHLTVAPPFRDYVGPGDAEFERVTGRFMLTTDDAGASGSVVGEPSIFELTFVEDLEYFHPSMVTTDADEWYLFDFSNAANVFKTPNLIDPVTDDGDPIAYARDLSGNDNHGGQSLLANRPLWKQAPNGLRGMWFDGTDDIFYLSQSVYTTAGFTVVACVQCTALDISSVQTIWAEVGEATDALIVMSTGTGRSQVEDDDATAKLRLTLRNDAAATTTMETDEAFADDNPRIVTLRDEAATQGAFIDNREEASTLARSGVFTITNQSLGAIDGTTPTPGSNNFYQGWIYGIFAIDRPLSDDDLAKVQEWLAKKYYAVMRQAEGVQTIPVVPRAIMFNGHRVISTVTQSGGIRLTDMEWDGYFRGRAYSPFSMGAVPGDAHSTPAIEPLVDGRLVAGWTGHNDKYWLRVTTGDSIAAGGWETTRNFAAVELAVANKNTYASLQEMATGVFTFFRTRGTGEVDTDIGYWFAGPEADPSDTFSAATKFILGNGTVFGEYVVGYATSPYRRDFQVSTGHPSVETANSIHHMYMAINPTTGAITWHETDGTPLTLPIDTADMTLVYDGTPDRAWICDMVVGSDGNPRMIYIVFNNVAVMGDYTYHYARWTGSAWVSAPIADGGATVIDGIFYATGGAVIDPEDMNTVIASCLPDGGSVVQAFRFTTTDNGLTFDAGVQITDDEQQVWGPVFIRGAAEPRLALTVGPFNDVGGNFIGDTRMRLANSVTGAWE